MHGFLKGFDTSPHGYSPHREAKQGGRHFRISFVQTVSASGFCTSPAIMSPRRPLVALSPMHDCSAMGRHRVCFAIVLLLGCCAALYTTASRGLTFAVSSRPLGGFAAKTPGAPTAASQGQVPWPPAGLVLGQQSTTDAHRGHVSSWGRSGLEALNPTPSGGRAGDGPSNGPPSGGPHSSGTTAFAADVLLLTVAVTCFFSVIRVVRRLRRPCWSQSAWEVVVRSGTSAGVDTTAMAATGAAEGGGSDACDGDTAALSEAPVTPGLADAWQDLHADYSSGLLLRGGTFSGVIVGEGPVGHMVLVPDLGVIGILPFSWSQGVGAASGEGDPEGEAADAAAGPKGANDGYGEGMAVVPVKADGESEGDQERGGGKAGDKVLQVTVVELDAEQQRLLVTQRSDAAARAFRLGTVHDAVVTKVGPQAALVALDGGVRSGRLPVTEISSAPVADPRAVFAPGDRLKCMVHRQPPADHRLEVSTRALEHTPGAMLVDVAAVYDAAEVTATSRAADYFRVGTVYEGVVVQVAPHAAFVDIGGQRGRLHVAQVSHAHVESARDVFAVGDAVTAIVCRYDGVLHLSTKALERRPGDMLKDPAGVYARAEDTAAWDSLRPGSVHEGLVEGLRPYGVVVDFGGLRLGVLRISEISAAPVTDLGAVFAVGDRIKCAVLEADRAARRLDVSTRALERAPGDMLRNPAEVYAGVEAVGQQEEAAAFQPGTVHEGVVRAVQGYGVVVELDGGRKRGLLHISQVWDQPFASRLVDTTPQYAN